MDSEIKYIKYMYKWNYFFRDLVSFFIKYCRKYTYSLYVVTL